MTLILFGFGSGSVVFCQHDGSKGFRIMFYNVENLFDIYDDTLKADDDFLPEGVLRWSYTRYARKLNSVYRSIAAAGEWNIPGVISMCEVENRKVIEELLQKTNLSRYEFGIIHEESSDIRGIDVCMIYRKDIVTLYYSRYFIPEAVASGNLKTRNVLYAKLGYNNDTLHLLANHWPSRRGGVLAGEKYRLAVAGMVRNICDSINHASSGMARIVICGDFNSVPGDSEIKVLLEGGNREPYLVNLAEDIARSGKGTYKYKGTWEMIDQFIVSKALLEATTGLYTREMNVRILMPGFLLEPDPVYPGSMPYSTYRGYKYNGGYSDHLPVLIDLFYQPPD